MSAFFQDLTDPGNAFAHLSCILLIASMLMTSLPRLRILALGSGIAAMLHFTLRTKDNASLMWEALFVLANAVQLPLLLYRSRQHDLRPEERAMFDQVLRIHEPLSQRRLLELFEWRDAAVGEVLITQEQHLPPLIYIASGAAAIQLDGQQVGVVGKAIFWAR